MVDRGRVDWGHGKKVDKTLTVHVELGSDVHTMGNVALGIDGVLGR